MSYKGNVVHKIANTMHNIRIELKILINKKYPTNT